MVIVGAGLFGSSSAHFLSKAGRRVLVLERFHLLHKKGSSSGESRITRYTYPSRLYTGLMTHSYKLWADVERESGVKVFEETGGLDVVEKGPTADAVIDACDAHGIPLEQLSADQVLDRYGMVIPSDSVGLVQNSSGILRATTAVATLQSLASRNGAIFRDNTKVTKIVEKAGDGGGFEIFVESSSDADAPRSYTCAKVLVACGAWAQPTLRQLGVDITLQVWQTTVCYWKAKGSDEYAENRKKLAALPVFIDYGNAPIWSSADAHISAGTGTETSGASAAPSAEEKPCIYSCPSRDFDGLIKIAVHHGKDVTADTRSFEPHAETTIEPVKKWLRSHLPFLDADAGPVVAETCMYTMTRDEAFIVDTLPTNRNIVVAAGFSGHGFKMGTVIGKALAELVLYDGESPTFGEYLKAFKITRPEAGYRLVGNEEEAH